MKIFVFVLTLLITTEAWAQPYGQQRRNSRETASLGLDRHAAYAAVGFTEGGFSIGLDYEYALAPTHGVGGYTRFYKKDDGRGEPGIFTAGAFIRPHFKRQAWNFYVSPGFGVVSIDSSARGGSATSFGPSLAFGLLYQIQSQIAIGVENMKTHIWFSDRYRGQVMDDLMLRARVSF